MKKMIVLTILVLTMSAPLAHAKTLKEAVNELSIKGITENTVIAVSFVVRNSLKLLCAPFYWLEKVSK
jgi:hypothetical protein